MNDAIQSPVAKKLADISHLLGADAIAFTNVRFALESIEQQAKAGDVDAAELVQIVNNFHQMIIGLAK